MYDAELLDRSNHPGFRGQLPDAKEFHLLNSSCGDEITIYLKIENNQITDGRWQGQGCAISLVSADLFIESVIGKTVKRALEIKAEFVKMILGQAYDPVVIGAAHPLKIVSRMPARVNCAKLPWQALE